MGFLISFFVLNAVPQQGPTHKLAFRLKTKIKVTKGSFTAFVQNMEVCPKGISALRLTMIEELPTGMIENKMLTPLKQIE